MEIDNTNNTVNISFADTEWGKDNELTFCKNNLTIPEFSEPQQKNGNKTIAMTITGKTANVIVVDDHGMGAIRARLVQNGYTDMRQAHLYILNYQDFPEINGHIYLSYYIRKNETKELLFLLLRKSN